MPKITFENIEYDVNKNSNGHDTFYMDSTEYYFMYNNKTNKIKGFSTYSHEPHQKDIRPHADFTTTINGIDYAPGEQAEAKIDDIVSFTVAFRNEAGNILTGLNAKFHTPIHVYIVDSNGVKTLGYRQVLVTVVKGHGTGDFTIKQEGIHEISQNEAKKAIIAAPFQVMVSA